MIWIKKIITYLFSIFLLKPLLKSKIFIFCFHDISNSDELHHSEFYSTNIQLFKKQIDFINKNFEIIGIEQLKTKHLLDNKMYAILTFDDGFKSVITEALPYLNKKKIPSTLFLNQTAIEKNQLWCSNLVLNKNNIEYLDAFYHQYFIKKSTEKQTLFINNNLKLPTNNLNYETIKYAERDTKNITYANKEDILATLNQYSTITIGNHTSNHYNLSNCTKLLQETEIVNNHNYIKNTFGLTMEHFAIPFGKKEHYNEDTLAILSENNYQFIYSTNPSYIKTDSNHFYPIFPRIGITNQTINQLIFYINRTLFKKIDI